MSRNTIEKNSEKQSEANKPVDLKEEELEQAQGGGVVFEIETTDAIERKSAKGLIRQDPDGWKIEKGEK